MMPHPNQNLRSTKKFYNLPCAHRQWRADSNCKLIHGYSRAFLFTFEAFQLDKCGFVVDYGDLDWLKLHLEYMYDHTLLLAGDDPELPVFKALEERGVCALRIQEEGIGMEGTAEYMGKFAEEGLRRKTKGRCWVVSVEAFENDKNSSIWYNPDAGFKGWL